MAELHLPARHLLAETRLQHSLQRGEMYRCSGCNFATHNARTMANHFAEKHGLDRAEQTDSVLKVEDYAEFDTCDVQHTEGVCSTNLLPTVYS